MILVFFSLVYGEEPKRIRTIGYADGESEPIFYLPKKVLSGPDGNLYVLDVGSVQIKVTTKEGKYLRTIGMAGQGPGEFVEPTDMYIEHDSLWVLDHSLMRVNLFTLDGQFIFSFDVQLMPFAFTHSNDFFICSHVMGNNSLVKYDVAGGILGFIQSINGGTGEFFDLSRMNPFQYMAYLTSSDNGSLFLSYLYKNKVEKYSMNLEILKTTELSETLKEPGIKRESSANMIYIDGIEISNGICYDGGKVFVLWQKEDPSSLECTGNSRITVFDDNLNALYTIDLQDCLTGFSIKNGTLYGTVEEPYPCIVIYELTHAE